MSHQKQLIHFNLKLVPLSSVGVLDGSLSRLCEIHQNFLVMSKVLLENSLLNFWMLSYLTDKHFRTFFTLIKRI